MPAAANAEAPAGGSHATVSMRLKVPGWLGVGLVAVGVDDVDADRGLGHGPDHCAQGPGRAP